MTTMTEIRVDARQVPPPHDLASWGELAGWLADHQLDYAIEAQPDVGNLSVAYTSNGQQIAHPGQWIVLTVHTDEDDEGGWSTSTFETLDERAFRRLVGRTGIPMDPTNGRGLSDYQTFRLDEFRRSITNHTPTREAIEDIHAVRTAAAELAHTIIASVDCSQAREFGDEGTARAQELALQRVEEAVMWAVKAIVLASGEPTDGVPQP
jgi:hypothetical protein